MSKEFSELSYERVDQSKEEERIVDILQRIERIDERLGEIEKEKSHGESQLINDSSLEGAEREAIGKNIEKLDEEKQKLESDKDACLGQLEIYGVADRYQRKG